MKKLFLAIAVVALLLVIWYRVNPGVQGQVDDYIVETILWTKGAPDMSVSDRADSLVVLSLTLRQNGRSDLARLALEQADSLLPAEPLHKGLLGLYAMEQNEPVQAIAFWKRGAASSPADANLTYLASLDTSDLHFLDNHMLERMFVDTLKNARLKTALYHAADSRVIAVTERKIRINNSLSYTFYALAALSLLFFARRALAKHKDAAPAEPSGGSGGVSATVTQAGLAAGVLKLAQVLAAFYGTIKLGKDVTSFVSEYVLTPYHLIDLLTSNVLFAGIFSVLVVLKVVPPTRWGSGSLLRKK